ncbi:MAG: amidase family protein, partial [Gammaproteobacteria bacterium]|nr:amidase family protein [Gammaproteobacteria bacterium]
MLKACARLDVPFSFSGNFVLTRSVRDCAAMLDAVSDHSHYAPRVPENGFLRGLARPPRALRIVATTETPSGRPVEPEITEAFEATLRLLESLGHRVELRAPQFDWRAFYRAFGTVGSAQLAADVRQLEQ